MMVPAAEPHDQGDDRGGTDRDRATHHCRRKVAIDFTPDVVSTRHQSTSIRRGHHRAIGFTP
jgi:hypothetical protein